MQKILLTLFVTCTMLCLSIAQTTRPTSQPTTSPSSQPSKKMNTMNAPYQSIGEFPDSYTPAAIVQRTIDGLGYRYHWASEGLTATDLAYDPGNAGKSAAEVIDHIYGLSSSILNVVLGKPNIRPYEEVKMTFEQTRHATLENLKAASDHLRANPNLDFSKQDVIFQRGEKSSNFPFWHLLNGQLMDAVYHTGQIVSYRRSSGNPSNPKVNVFSGRNPNATN